MSLNKVVENLALSAKGFFKKKLSTKFVIVLVLIILMPNILKYLNPKMEDSGNHNVQIPLFSIDLKFQSDLDNTNISDELRKEFEVRQAGLSQSTTISVVTKSNEWSINDKGNQHTYLIRKQDEELNIYTHQGLGIKNLIRKVKWELSETENERINGGEEALFELKDFDLEISFVVQTRQTQSGNVEYYFVSVDSETQTSLERIQKIKLHMTAIAPKKYVEEASEDNFPRSQKSPVNLNNPPPKKGENP